MGHQINHYTTKATTEKNLKAWISRITDSAYDPQETSCYHGNLTIHKDKVYKDYNEALAAIEKYDNGWYDDHIVKYYDLSDEGRKKYRSGIRKRMRILKRIPFTSVPPSISAVRNAEAS